MNYDTPSSWVISKIFSAKTQALYESLKPDRVPYMAPVDFNPYQD